MTAMRINKRTSIIIDESNINNNRSSIINLSNYCQFAYELDFETPSFRLSCVEYSQCNNIADI